MTQYNTKQYKRQTLLEVLYTILIKILYRLQYEILNRQNLNKHR